MATIVEIQLATGTRRIELRGRQVIVLEPRGRNRVQQCADAATAREVFERTVWLQDDKGPMVRREEPGDEEWGEADVLFTRFVSEHDAKSQRVEVTLDDTMGPGDLADLVRLVADRGYRFVHVVSDGAALGDAFGTVAREKGLPNLRGFAQAIPWAANIERQEEARFGPVDAFLAAAPALERLYLAGTLSWEKPTRHDRLEEATFASAPLSETFLSALGRSRFPRLERLGLMIGGETSEPPEAATLACLTAETFPRLERLDIAGLGSSVGAFLERLASTAMAEQLRLLSLMSEAWDEDGLIEPLLKCRARFPRLERLEVSTADLSEEGLESARKIFPGVLVEERIRLFDSYDVWQRPEPKTKPWYRFWSALLFVLLTASGCSTLGGAVEEARTDTVLGPYLRHVRYAGSAERLAKLVLDDLQKHERWHREHNLIHRINVAAGQPTATIVATPKALDTLGSVLARGTRTERVETSRAPASESEPFRVEFRSVRETYVLSELRDGFMVAVTNRGDGDRLFHRELEFLRRADPRRAERLRTKILAEHPEVVLDPWQE